MNNKWPIKKKLLFCTSILIFISVMIVTIISSRNYKKSMIELSYENKKVALQQLTYNIETYLKSIQELCVIPYYDIALIEALSTEPKNSSEILKKQRAIESFLSKNILLPHDDIQDAYIFSNRELYSSIRDQKYISSSKLDENLINKITNNRSPVILYSDEDSFNFTILSNIFDMKDNNKSIGILRIDVNTKGLDKVSSKVLDWGEKALIITNENMKLIYGKSKTFDYNYVVQLHNEIYNSNINESNILTFDKDEFLVTAVEIPLTSWKVYDLSSLKAMNKDINAIQFRSILIGLLCSTIGIILSTQLVTRFLNPIFEVTNLMKKVQVEDYSVKATVTGDDEIAYLSSTFNEMIDKIDATMKKNILLTKKIYESKYLEKEAQYVAMCNQIKPHFLFNSLNTISLLIKVNRKEESIDYIEKLASLLNGLVHADSEITIRSEILICKNYLSMQCIRYTNLSYEIDINKEHLDYLIPAITLQPIIENALIHGFSRKEDECFIKITSIENDDNISIIINDNGIGISEEKLTEITYNINNPDSHYINTNKRVALVNIAKRIKLKYGDNYGLQVSSIQTKGSTFSITIPKTMGEKNV